MPGDQFVYDPVQDRFIRPEEQFLRRQGTPCSARAGGGIIYRASPKVCGACPRRAACCGVVKARTITRPDDSGLYDRTRAYLRTSHARRSIRLRKCWAETVMAEAKERHGLRRAQCRGQSQVRIQALGVAIAYNIKKLAQWHGPRPQAIALAQRAERLQRWVRPAGQRCLRPRPPSPRPDFGNRPPAHA